MKKKIAFLIVIALLAVCSAGSYTVAESDVLAVGTYQSMNYTQGLVTAYYLNLRQGPSIDFYITKVLEKDDAVRIIGKMSDWYAVVDLKSGCIGCVHSKFIKVPALAPVEELSIEDENGIDVEVSIEKPVEVSEEEQTLLDLINKSRMEAGLEELKFDAALLDTARTKAEDMVENDYFSHESIAYGSPWDMIKKFGIDFRTAGENIAGNKTIEGAYNAWINSDTHKKNILSDKFSYTGIGIVDSPTYGKVIVQQFIGN